MTKTSNLKLQTPKKLQTAKPQNLFRRDSRHAGFWEFSRFGFYWNLGFGFWSLLWLLSLNGALAAATNDIAVEEIPPLRPPHGEIPTIWLEQHRSSTISLAVLGIVAVAALVWHLRRPRKVVPVPPEAQARLALERLRPQPEDGVQLSRISNILRQYVVAGFDLPPGERTTTEFCKEVATWPKMTPKLAADLEEFLRQCDERKFSPPAPRLPLSAVDRALELINLAEVRRTELRSAEALAQSGPSTINQRPST